MKTKTFELERTKSDDYMIYDPETGQYSEWTLCEDFVFENFRIASPKIRVTISLAPVKGSKRFVLYKRRYCWNFEKKEPSIGIINSEGILYIKAEELLEGFLKEVGKSFDWWEHSKIVIYMKIEVA